MPATIAAIGHLTITTPDLPRAVAFYRDILGMKLVVAGEWFNAFEIGSVHLCLMPGPVQEIPFDLATSDVEGMRQRLRAHGVPCTGIVSGVWSGHIGFSCTDPDGRRIGIQDVHRPMPPVEAPPMPATHAG